MPMSYQRWEMASGPTVAYNLAGRTNCCVVVESTKGSNFSSFRIQDTMSRGFGETPKSSNYRISSSQDNVVWGLSALSLRGHAQADTDLSTEDNRSVSLGAFCCASAESYRCACPKSTDSSLLAYAQPSGCWKPLKLDIPACDESFVSSSKIGNQASTLHTHENATGNYLHADVEPSPPQTAAILNHVTAPLGFCCGDKASEHGSIGSFSKTLRSTSSSLHSRRSDICEDDEVEPDIMSDSSFSSENGMLLLESSSSFGEASHDDTEAESGFKEPTGLSCSVGASSPPRKGLSKFYGGKARSFSCLMDVGSVKDLAKPEVPHAKKRRAHSGSSGLPPLQKGASAISKKPLHSGKSTLALAVAMTKKEEYEVQASVGAQRQQESLVPSRSYSLSDLEGATQSMFFIG